MIEAFDCGRFGAIIEFEGHSMLLRRDWRASTRRSNCSSRRQWASCHPGRLSPVRVRSEEHTSELQSLMRISYAVFCLKKKKIHQNTYTLTLRQHKLKTSYLSDIKNNNDQTHKQTNTIYIH